MIIIFVEFIDKLIDYPINCVSLSFKDFFIISSWLYMLFILKKNRLEWVYSIFHYFKEDRKDIPKLFQFASSD